ncbi:hypothetical protein Hypma_014659 [Hypsizygus marmoreus]|uniref:Uncharacterized protein n=1 Tax=Hypsizygus marmoreus TaxID=39966 RepID=A0A369JG13_HYPMA|nr:hypothetical protein Hypma_014659 [Hypsizygus marmoreus]
MSSTPALASKPVNVPGKCAPLTPDLYLVQVNQEEGLCTSSIDQVHRDLALKAFDFLRTQHQDVSMFLVTSLKEAATLIGQKVIASLHSPEKESASNALENGRRSHPDAVILLSLHSEQALEFMEHGEFMGWKFNDGANA